MTQGLGIGQRLLQPSKPSVGTPGSIFDNAAVPSVITTISLTPLTPASLRITFSPPADVGAGSGVALSNSSVSYIVSITTGSTGATTNVSVTSSPYVHSQVVVGDVYGVRMVACNGAGCGSFSSSFSRVLVGSNYAGATADNARPPCESGRCELVSSCSSCCQCHVVRPVGHRPWESDIPCNL
jgi:hypothetical protein